MIASDDGVPERSRYTPMTTKHFDGGGDLPADVVHPVRLHRILNAKFPDVAKKVGSTPIISSTQ